MIGQAFAKNPLLKVRWLLVMIDYYVVVEAAVLLIDQLQPENVLECSSQVMELFKYTEFH